MCDTLAQMYVMDRMENNALHCMPVGTIHFSHYVHVYLDRELPDLWIGGGGSTPWPPHSPDFITLDFFWEFVKDIVYCGKVQNLNKSGDSCQSCRVHYH